MQDGLEGTAFHFVAQDVGHIRVGLAGVDHQRQPRRPRRRDMGPEDGLRDLARDLVVVVVEPRFADADAFRVTREGHEPFHRDIGFLCSLMGMSPDREEHVGVAFGDGRDVIVARHAGRNRDDPADPRCSGSRHHGIDLGSKLRKIEMAVAVGQHQPPARRSAER